MGAEGEAVKVPAETPCEVLTRFVTHRLFSFCIVHSSMSHHLGFDLYRGYMFSEPLYVELLFHLESLLCWNLVAPLCRRGERLHKASYTWNLFRRYRLNSTPLMRRGHSGTF